MREHIGAICGLLLLVGLIGLLAYVQWWILYYGTGWARNHGYLHTDFESLARALLILEVGLVLLAGTIWGYGGRA